MRPLGIGVLGAADIAWRRTLPALAEVPDARLVAVAARDVDRARRFTDRYGGRPLPDYDRLLEDPEVDAVYLPLPNALHAYWARRALEAGRHVLVEKPLTTRYRDTLGLVGLARRRGLVVAENMMFLHHAQHTEVARLVAAGVIGEPRGFSGVFAVPPRPDGDIRLSQELGGGALLDQGVYPLRAALRLLGEELDVRSAVLRYDDPRYGVDVSGAALLCTPEGLPAQLRFGMDGAYRAGYAVYGTAGRIEVARAFTPPDDHWPVLTVESGGRTEERVLSPDRQFVNALRAFVAAVRAGGDRAAEEGSLRQARLVDEIRVAAGTRVPELALASR
jgi:NDP-hexose-3-ketoreductase